MTIERDGMTTDQETRGCQGEDCICTISSRHEWFQAFCQERDLRMNDLGCPSCRQLAQEREKEQVDTRMDTMGTSADSRTAPTNEAAPTRPVETRSPIARAVEDEIARLTALVKFNAETAIRYQMAIEWALGERGEFGEEPPPLAGKYRQRYWWRSELRRRAGFPAARETPSDASPADTVSDGETLKILEAQLTEVRDSRTQLAQERDDLRESLTVLEMLRQSQLTEVRVERDEAREAISSALDANEATAVLKARIVELKDQLTEVRSLLEQMRPAISGTRERVSLAGFLKRLRPHVDHADWQRALDEFVQMATDLDHLLASLPREGRQEQEADTRVDEGQPAAPANSPTGSTATSNEVIR